MTAHPDVLSALQTAHNAEATASEKFHKQEHAFENAGRKIPKLAKWFDKRHKESYQRQHQLRNTIMEHGGTVDTELGDTSYSEEPGEALKKACTTIDGLAVAHQAVHDSVKDAEGTSSDEEKAYHRGIREKYRDTVKDLHKTYLKGERKQQMLKDLGPALFIHKHS